MKDYVGDEALKLNILREFLLNTARKLNFDYVEFPNVEQELLYTSSLGETSDVVEKEMFYLNKRENASRLVLKPEGTASVVRLYFENNLQNLPQPVKLTYFERMYRLERPQQGRFREHRQFGLEMLGSDDPICDFEIISSFIFILNKLKITDAVVKINSIGCIECRSRFKKDLKKYYSKLLKKVCLDCQRRYKLNPLRLLDCKNENCIQLKNLAPNILNYLCRDCQAHFQKVIEYIDLQKLNYEIDPFTVRGFDYYNRTVFEIFVPNKDFALIGGGRYDYLANFISDQQLFAVGGSLGVERLISVINERNINLPSTSKKPRYQVFLAFVGEESRMKAYEIFMHLLEHDFDVKHALAKKSLSAQLEVADKLGVKYTLILGMLEISQNTIILRDMLSGNQEILPQSRLIEELKKSLSSN